MNTATHFQTTFLSFITLICVALSFAWFLRDLSHVLFAVESDKEEINSNTIISTDFDISKSYIQETTNNLDVDPNTQKKPSPQCDGVYSQLRHDRSGAAIKEMLEHSFCAYQQNKTYCGACGGSDYKTVHRHLLDTMGLKDKLPIYDKCPQTAEVIPKKNVPCDFLRLSHKNKKFAKWRNHMTATVQTHVQKTITSSSGDQLEKDNKTCSIVVHVRRGDCDPSNAIRGKLCILKYLPNSYFLPLIEQAQSRHATECSVVVHTEEAYSDTLNTTNKMASAEGNDVFYDRNFTVVVGGDEAKAWIDFVTADELIVSKSSFSLVPAVFGLGNVYYPDTSKFYMPEWTIIHTDNM